MDSDDARKLCHRVELIGGNGCLDPVVRRRHLRLHLATRALDRLHDLALRIGERRLDVVALALAEFAAALGLDDGDGVSSISMTTVTWPSGPMAPAVYDESIAPREDDAEKRAPGSSSGVAARAADAGA
jgi:hypothetical protein